MVNIVMRRNAINGRERPVDKADTRQRAVRVLPTSDLLRKFLKHGVSRVGFPQSEGSAEWPLDQFTKRRIRDGDVVIEGTPGAKRLAAPKASKAQAKEAPKEEPKAEPKAETPKT